MFLSNHILPWLLGLLLSMLSLTNGWAQQSIHVYSLDIPWQSTPDPYDSSRLYTLAAAISQAQPGDSIIIHEGIYRERVQISKSNLVLTRYQEDYVLVSGNERVENWTAATGMAPGVMQADVSGLGIESEFSQLFVDGRAEMMARHPNNTIGHMMLPLEANAGYSLLTNVEKAQGTVGAGSATFDQAIPNVDLTGGIFRGLTGKMRNYVFGSITAQNGNTVSFTGLNKGQWQNSAAIANTKHKVSWGFLLHKNLIDIPGEWFLDGNTLYFLPPAHTTLSDASVEVQVRNQILKVNNAQDISFVGINFVAGHGELLNSSNLSFEKCSWRHLQPFWIPNNYGDNDSDNTGMFMDNTSQTMFKDCYLGQSWGNAFAILDGSNHTFENCIIEDIAWIGIFASAIYTRTGPVTVRNCTFGDAGRFHLRLRSDDKIEVYDSDFYGAMMMGEDAGPIEATSTGKLTPLDLKESVFAYNKVHDCHGIPVFDGGYAKQFIVAFYMEDTENYTAHHNLVYNIVSNNYTGSQNMEEAGAFLYLGPRYNYMSRPVNYYNNTVWNYDKSINIWHIEADNWQELNMVAPGGSMQDGHFENNIFLKDRAFKLNWTKQILNSNGGRVDWVSVSNPPKIETNDFNAYVTHCQGIGYNFNALNTIIIDENDEALNFVDAGNGNFRLKSSSAAKGAGKEIPGITSSANPDCGALEGSDRVLAAGATLVKPPFKEVKNRATSLEKELQQQQLSLFPNPTQHVITLTGQEVLTRGATLEIYAMNGELVKSQLLTQTSSSVEVDIADLPKGVYLLRVSQWPNQAIRFMKK